MAFIAMNLTGLPYRVGYEVGVAGEGYCTVDLTSGWKFKHKYDPGRSEPKMNYCHIRGVGNIAEAKAGADEKLQTRPCTSNDKNLTEPQDAFGRFFY